jgi:hypothetical protein
MGTRIITPADVEQQGITRPAICPCCQDQNVAAMAELCTWCIALRHAARYTPVKAIEYVLEMKRRGELL